MSEMSFAEYLIRESFPELSDEEIEKILKRIREEGKDGKKEK